MDLADDSVAILKYKINGNFHFHVMDKFDEPDEVKRLERMMGFGAAMADIHGESYEELWIKICPIFATK